MLEHFADPHARKFGVEIECGIDGGMETVRKLFKFRSDSYRNDTGWALEYDGSGVELKTPPLQGEAGFETVLETMSILKDAGAYVTDEDGLHVHHDAPEFISDPQRCMQLLTSWVNNQSVIEEMVAPKRRDAAVCPRWQSYDMEMLKQWSSEADGYLDLEERNDLNLSALEAHGTIEIRLHEGTLDGDVAVSWIQFGQRFIHRAIERKSPMPKAVSDQYLLSRIRLSKRAQQILAAKKAAGHHTEASSYGAK